MLISLLACNNSPFGFYADDVKWVLLAEAFLRGSAQTAWSAVPLPDTSITWGFGLLLTPVVSLFGRQPLAFKMFSALCAVIGNACFYLAVRRMLDTGGRIFLLVGLGGAAFLVGFSGSVISEAGYLLLFGLLLFLVSRWHLRFLHPRRVFLAGALAGALFLVRSIGIVAPCSLIALGRRFFLSRSGWFFLGGFIFVAAPVTVIIFRLSGAWSFYGPYWELGPKAEMAEMAERFFQNIYFYWKGLSCMTVVNLPALLSPHAWVKGGAMFLGVACAGRGIWRWSSHPVGRFLGLYFLGNLIVIGFWTYQEPRYVLPIYPVFLAFLGSGMGGLYRKLWGRIVLGVLLFGSLVSNAPEIVGLIRTSLSADPVSPHESERWLAGHCRPEEIVVSMDIASVYYHAGLRGVPFIPSTDEASFEAGARRLGATYFFFREQAFVPAAPGVLDPIAQQYEKLKKYLFGSESFVPVYRNASENTTIFRLRDARLSTPEG